MYHNLPVLDVHGHVSVPASANSFLVMMMGSNTPMASPIGQEKAGPAGVTLEDFRAAERNAREHQLGLWSADPMPAAADAGGELARHGRADV